MSARGMTTDKLVERVERFGHSYAYDMGLKRIRKTKGRPKVLE
jgi:hypothetical protein